MFLINIDLIDFFKKAQWSLFTAILRKSHLYLQACVEIGLIETALHELEDADSICADLIVEMLTVLVNYSITVEELKAIFNKLKGSNKYWVFRSLNIKKISFLILFLNFED